MSHELPAGTITKYTCKLCGKDTYTVQLNTGIIANSIDCTTRCTGIQCTGLAYKAKTNEKFPQISLVYVRPVVEIFNELEREAQEIVLGGGLLILPVDGIPGTTESKYYKLHELN